jgi:hypothetical protein
MNEFPTNAFVTVGASSFPEPPPAPPTIVVSDTVDSLLAAGMLGVTPNNLRQIVHKKQLTPVGKAGRRTIFRRSDVEALAASRKGQP